MPPAGSAKRATAESLSGDRLSALPNGHGAGPHLGGHGLQKRSAPAVRWMRWWMCEEREEGEDTRVEKKEVMGIVFICSGGADRDPTCREACHASSCGNLYQRILANSPARERGHVSRFSRPSDRPGERAGSSVSRPFCKKNLARLLLTAKRGDSTTCASTGNSGFTGE